MAHAQRVAGRELRRAAVMAERVGEQKLADMLGHSPIETTRIYLLTTGQEHRRQMEKLRLVF